HEIIFVRSASEGINLVAQTYGRKHVGAGDEVLISAMEHHSNIVPWQMLCEEKGAKLQVAPINDRGELILEKFEQLLGPRTKIAAVGHVSNALGTINPVEQIVPSALETCPTRSEEHTSELQSQSNLVCRLLLEKKKNTHNKRLGLNYQQIPVNAPVAPVRTYSKDGVMRIENRTDPVY